MAKEDVNFLEKDAIYRNEMDTNYLNAFTELSNIFTQGRNEYLGIDQQRKADAMSKRLSGQAQAANAAARGLGSSGIGRRNAGEVLAGAGRQESATSAKEDQIRNQYGLRTFLNDQKQEVALQEAINNKNYTELAKVFGLLGQSLGSSGLTAFNTFNAASSSSEAAAATRAAEKALQNTGRWR